MVKIPEVNLHNDGSEWDAVQISGHPSARGAYEAIDAAREKFSGAIELALIATAKTTEGDEFTDNVISLTERRLRRRG